MNIGERNWHNFVQTKNNVICGFAFNDKNFYLYLGKPSGEIDRIVGVGMAEKDYDAVMKLLAFLRCLKRLVFPSIFFLLGFLVYKLLIV